MLNTTAPPPRPIATGDAALVSGIVRLHLRLSGRKWRRVVHLYLELMVQTHKNNQDLCFLEKLLLVIVRKMER